MAERRPTITPVERHPQALQFIERDGCLFGERPYQAGLTQPVTTLERVVVELLRGIAWKAWARLALNPRMKGEAPRARATRRTPAPPRAATVAA
jgi:hypothetical protein